MIIFNLAWRADFIYSRMTPKRLSAGATLQLILLGESRDLSNTESDATDEEEDDDGNFIILHPGSDGEESDDAVP